MKNAFLSLLLSLALFAMSGCNLLDSSQERATTTLEIHLQDFFEVHARVEVDQQVVFEGEVTADSFSGPAEVIPVDLSTGSHELVVTVNGTVEAKTSFGTESTSVIGVRYNAADARVQFVFYTEPPLYL